MSIRQAIELYNAGEYRRCAAVLRPLVKSDCDDPIPYQLAARVLGLHEGKWPEAMKRLREGKEKFEAFRGGRLDRFDEGVCRSFGDALILSAFGWAHLYRLAGEYQWSTSPLDVPPAVVSGVVEQAGHAITFQPGDSDCLHLWQMLESMEQEGALDCHRFSGAPLRIAENVKRHVTVAKADALRPPDFKEVIVLEPYETRLVSCDWTVYRTKCGGHVGVHSPLEELQGANEQQARRAINALKQSWAGPQEGDQVREMSDFMRLRSILGIDCTHYFPPSTSLRYVLAKIGYYSASPLTRRARSLISSDPALSTLVFRS